MRYELDEAYINCVFGRIQRPHVLKGLSQHEQKKV